MSSFSVRREAPHPTPPKEKGSTNPHKVRCPRCHSSAIHYHKKYRTFICWDCELAFTIEVKE